MLLTRLGYMPPRSTHPSNATFLFVGFGPGGEIRQAISYRAPAKDGIPGGLARSLITGFESFHVYQIKRSAGGDLEFERLR